MATSPSMWTRTEQLARQHDQGGSTWLKLAGDGDRAVVVFLGEPHPREVCFVDGKYMPYDEALKAQGLKPSLRVALNVALHDTREVKVLEQGVVFFKDLLQVRAKYGLERWAFEVQRHGAAKDPKTTYSILPEKQLTPEEQRTFQALQQHDLAALYSAEPAEAETSAEARQPLAAEAAKPGPCVDPKTAQSIAVVLKAMPRQAVDQFCQKFGVGRIKDLPAAQVEKAVAYLDVLEVEFGKGKNAVAADPFA